MQLMDIMMHNKIAADSLLSICVPLSQKNPDGEAYLFSSMLSYTIEFCSQQDIKMFLDNHQNVDLVKDETIDFAYGYTKIGEYGKAIKLLSDVCLGGSVLDSLNLHYSYPLYLSCNFQLPR